ncbi:MAG: hypothetical protein J7J61_00460 [Candidatus Hydrothermae bacterium]|nr:hypothetical protein [Candidatus Hydrothermae bacterium]
MWYLVGMKMWGRIKRFWQKLMWGLEAEEVEKMRQACYVLRWRENPDEEPEWVFEIWGKSGWGPCVVERLGVKDRDKLNRALLEVYRRTQIPWHRVWVVDPITGELKPATECGARWKEYRLRM